MAQSASNLGPLAALWARRKAVDSLQYARFGPFFSINHEDTRALKMSTKVRPNSRMDVVPETTEVSTWVPRFLGEKGNNVGKVRCRCCTNQGAAEQGLRDCASYKHHRTLAKGSFEVASNVAAFLSYVDSDVYGVPTSGKRISNGS